MSLKDQPAFPVPLNQFNDAMASGMTIRQYAAIKAMQGLVGRDTRVSSFGFEREIFDLSKEISKRACLFADALLAELEKPAQKGEGK